MSASPSQGLRTLISLREEMEKNEKEGEERRMWEKRKMKKRKDLASSVLNTAVTVSSFPIRVFLPS